MSDVLPATPTEPNEDLDWYRDLGEGFEEVETSFGTKIDWDKLEKGPTGHPMFFGTYWGTTTIDVPDETTGEIVPIKIHLFKDDHGEPHFSWHSPRLDYGLASAPEGSDVVIVWEGLEKLGTTKTMNTFRIAVRKPRPVDA